MQRRRRKGDVGTKKADLTEKELKEKTLKLHECIYNDDLSEAESIVRNLCKESRRSLTKANDKLGTPPALFIAIDEGSDFLGFLVNKCNADIEEPLGNKHKLSSQYSPEMTPLEFALSKSQEYDFEFLLKAGADPTRLLQDREVIFRICRECPLSVEALRVLTTHGVDFNASDDAGFTCLMHSAQYPDHRCRSLLKFGVNVNLKNRVGNTALHIAAKLKSLNPVKDLVQFGADPLCKNNQGYDPLHVACFYCHDAIVKFLVTAVKDVNRQIQAYQLLGNCRILYENDFAYTKALNRWKKGVLLYMANQIQTPAATLTTPFGIATEAMSVTDLDELRRDRDLLAMQPIVLSHKIFGPNHAMFFSSIERSATRYFRTFVIDKWMKMLIYYLQMLCDSFANHHERSSQVIERLMLRIKLEFTAVYDAMLSVNFNLVYEFMDTVLQTVRKCTGCEEKKTLGGLIFGAIVLFLSDDFENHRTVDQKFEFRRLVRSAVTEMHGQWIRTALIDSFCDWPSYITYSDTFPVLEAFTMLLECGADIDERDQDNCNVVHYLYERRQTDDFDQLSEIAAKCVDYNIHLDARNRKGMTTAKCLQGLNIRIDAPINLMCLAARAICDHKIPVQGILPKVLIEFVELH